MTSTFTPAAAYVLQVITDTDYTNLEQTYQLLTSLVVACARLPDKVPVVERLGQAVRVKMQHIRIGKWGHGLHGSRDPYIACLLRIHDRIDYTNLVDRCKEERAKDRTRTGQGTDF